MPFVVPALDKLYDDEAYKPFVRLFVWSEGGWGERAYSRWRRECRFTYDEIGTYAADQVLRETISRLMPELTVKWAAFKRSG
jgi:hypothetical protein